MRQAKAMLPSGPLPAPQRCARRPIQHQVSFPEDYLVAGRNAGRNCDLLLRQVPFHNAPTTLIPPAALRERSFRSVTAARLTLRMWFKSTF
jgi:hypothetical protein